MKGVLLDIDGTLIDSNEAHARSWAEALADAGVPVNYADVRAKIGEGGDHLLPELTGISPESDLGKRLKERRAEIFRVDFLPRLRVFPGARALLELFRERGIRFLAVTSSSRADADALLRQAGLADLVTERVTADDAESSKPDPDLVCAGLGKIGLAAHEVVMLGDTPYDIFAASRAGVGAIAFTCGGWPRERLRGALEIYAGPWELLAAFGKSCFAADRAAA